MILAPYIDVKLFMLPGDVIAFGGKSWFSGQIKRYTRSPISHVAVVIRQPLEGVRDPYNVVLESTTGGVRIQRLSDAISKYNGEVWWLPLSAESRQRFDVGSFNRFGMDQVGKPYDDLQCWLLPIGLNRENYDAHFCSELATACHKASGLVPQSINASETIPIELCRFKLYAEDYQQLKGVPTPIPGFNSIPL